MLKISNHYVDTIFFAQRITADCGIFVFRGLSSTASSDDRIFFCLVGKKEDGLEILDEVVVPCTFEYIAKGRSVDLAADDVTAKLFLGERDDVYVTMRAISPCEDDVEKRTSFKLSYY